MRVGGNFSSQAVSIRDDGLHLLQRVLGSLRIVALGKHSAGRADLDQIGTVLDVLADLVLHGRNPVGHSVPRSVILVGQQIVVAVAARDAERWPAYQHSRSGYVAGVDCGAQSAAAIAFAPSVAHGGETRPQGHPAVL